VVDDQLFFRQLIAQYFRVYGVKSVHVAGDGQEALDYLYKNRHSVDVVVSDIEMPVMDGYQLVSNVKSTPALRDLPVMALTSLGGNRNVQKGLDAGFDAYEVKLDKENVLKSLTALYQKATRK
jgi:two-component system, chemotaxis family, sensor kinase CheA